MSSVSPAVAAGLVIGLPECSLDGCVSASYVAFRILGVDADDKMAIDARAWVCELGISWVIECGWSRVF